MIDRRHDLPIANKQRPSTSAVAASTTCHNRFRRRSWRSCTASIGARGFVYLAVVLNWFSRRVLSWRLSITMEASFCLAGT
jgi:transposase InsO family protein